MPDRFSRTENTHRVGNCVSASRTGLVQAVRDCPFVSRQATMLNVLLVAVPEGEELLSGLLRDPELGPLTLLVRRHRAVRGKIRRRPPVEYPGHRGRALDSGID